MPLIEIDGDVPDDVAMQIAQQQMGQGGVQGQGQDPFRDLMSALQPVFDQSAQATPTMPQISGGDVVGLGLQGVQQLQGQAQQSVQDQIMQRERARQRTTQQLEAEKDRQQQIKLYQQELKNQQNLAKIRADEEKFTAKLKAENEDAEREYERTKPQFVGSPSTGIGEIVPGQEGQASTYRELQPAPEKQYAPQGFMPVSPGAGVFDPKVGKIVATQPERKTAGNEPMPYVWTPNGVMDRRTGEITLSNEKTTDPKEVARLKIDLMGDMISYGEEFDTATKQAGKLVDDLMKQKPQPAGQRLRYDPVSGEIK